MTLAFREVFLDPLHDSQPAGLLLGNVLFAPGVTPIPAGEIDTEQTRHQLTEVFTTMDRILERAGAGRSDVTRVTVFMRDVLERPILNEVWAEWYPDPDDRPPHKYVPAILPDGVNVALQMLGLLGMSRIVLEIPGVQHGDPMSMGARVGNLVTSSRIFGSQPSLDEQISLIMERAETLMQQAGGSLSDLTQATFFVGDAEIASAVERRWSEDWGRIEGAPILHVIEAFLGGGNGWPRVEVMGIVDGA